MTRKQEFKAKLKRVTAFLDNEGFDAVLINKLSNFSWLTAGATCHVSVASPTGVAALLVTKKENFVIADNIEIRRMMDEEIRELDFTPVSCYWYEDSKEKLIEGIAKGLKLCSDSPFGNAKLVDGSFGKLRYSLLEPEIKRYKALGKIAGDAILKAAGTVKPGMTEHQIGSIVGKALHSNGAQPVVNLVAVDGRISSYRHPVPTGRKLRKYAMIVTCARKWGLILSMTRIVHFGKPDAVLRKKHDAVASVDASFIVNTVPGRKINEIFSEAVAVYGRTGFADEWRRHHQGGAAGYEARDYKANFETAETVKENQAFAWNPSITGTKSEDTIIADKRGQTVISGIDGWPMLTVEYNGKKIKRPDILVR